MADIWLPGYDRWPLPGVPGVPYDEWDDPKALLHMTQGTSINGAVEAYKAYPPHTIANFKTKGKAQHIPLNRGAYALWNEDADDSRCYQVEIVGFSENAPNMSEEELKWLGEEVLLPLHEYGGVPLVVVWKGFKAPSDVNYMLATASSPLRLTQAELDSFSGILGHQHIPKDNHWDPGGLRVPRMIEYAKNKLRMREDDMFSDGDRITLQEVWSVLEALKDGLGERRIPPKQGEELKQVKHWYEVQHNVRNFLGMRPRGDYTKDQPGPLPAPGSDFELVKAIKRIEERLTGIENRIGLGRPQEPGTET